MHIGGNAITRKPAYQIKKKQPVTGQPGMQQVGTTSAAATKVSRKKHREKAADRVGGRQRNVSGLVCSEGKGGVGFYLTHIFLSPVAGGYMGRVLNHS